jgi:hypothetical protein
MTQILAVFSLVAASLREAGMNLDKLENEINVSLQGHLPLSLITPVRLRRILENIKYHIPSTMTLPNNDRDSLTWYYQHLPTTVVSSNGRIHVITVIPITYADSLYDMFTIISIPIPVLGSDKATEIMLEGRHMAISNDRTRYIIIAENEARWSCPSFNINFCPIFICYR